jgi:hypothetical protein
MVTGLSKRNGSHLAYQKWVLNGKLKEINRSVLAAYHSGGLQSSNFFSRMRFNTTEAANGVTLAFEQHIGEDESQHYVDYLRSRFLGLGYKVEHSYREMSDQTMHVEVTDKYFLRALIEPARRKQSEPNHRNVTFEYVCVNNKPSHCKIVLMTQVDKKYSPDSDFKQLMGTLFEF